MIDPSGVLNYSKEIPKETVFIKNLIQLTNDCKAYLNQFKLIFDSELKEVEPCMRQILSLCKSFNLEVISSNLVNEDVTNFLNSLQYYLILQEGTATNYLDDYVSVNNSFNNEYSRSIVCPNFLEILPFIKDYLSHRSQQKSNTTKIEKSMREMNSAIQEKKREVEKSNYNTTIKSKLDERISKYVGEYYESMSSYQSSIPELQNSEKTLNEQISSLTEGTVKYLYQFFLKLRSIFSIVLEGKLLIFCKQINNILGNLDLISKLKIESSEGIITNYISVKQLKIQELNQINLETQYTKSSFSNSNLFETLINHLNIVSQVQGSKRKILGIFLKFVKDRLKITDSFVTNWVKMISKYSGISTRQSFQHSIILQMNEVFRAVNDVIGKKLNEYYKNFAGFIAMIEQQLKDLAAEEANISDIKQKLQKDSGSFKEAIFKNANATEKVLLSIDNIKQEISKGCEDPNNFVKFESKLHCGRIEENELKEEKEQLHKKTLKYLEEFLPTIKTVCTKAYKSLSERNQEMKDNLINYEKANLKHFDDIKSYLDVYKNQFSNVVIEEEIRKIFVAKDFIDKQYLVSINLNDEEAYSNYLEKIFNLRFLDVRKYDRKRISDLYQASSSQSIETLNNEVVLGRKSSVAPESAEPELPSLILNFLEDTFKVKSYLISEEILSKEEFNEFLQQYKSKDEKQDLKKHDGIFSVDSNEKIYNSFSCGLSSTILLQGKIYVTSKKIVFSSWFNASTLFGKTLIEIPLLDIVDINKKKNLLFDNSILIQTKNSEFYFTSFVNNRGECFNNIREALIASGNTNFLDKGDSNNSFEAGSDQKHISKSQPHSKKASIDHNLIKEKISSPQTQNVTLEAAVDSAIDSLLSFRDFPQNSRESNEEQNQIEDNPVVIEENAISEIEIKQKKPLKELIEDLNLRKKLENCTKNRIESFNRSKGRAYNETFVVDHKLANLPLAYVFDCLYNPERVIKAFGYGKNYLHSFKLSVNDTDINCTFNRDEFKLPDDYQLKGDYGLVESIFDAASPNENLLKKLSDSLDEVAPEELYQNPSSIVIYNSNHPIPNPKFMGPKKLDVKEEVRTYLLSPTCFVADHHTNLTGFMMMDTFNIVTSFKYEALLNMENFFETKVSVSFFLEFIKPCYFKDKVTKESLADNREYVKKEILVKMMKALEEMQDEFSRRKLNYKNTIKEEPKPLKVSPPQIKLKIKNDAIKELSIEEVLSGKPVSAIVNNEVEQLNSNPLKVEDPSAILPKLSERNAEIKEEIKLESSSHPLSQSAHISDSSVKVDSKDITNLKNIGFIGFILFVVSVILGNNAFGQLNSILQTMLLILIIQRLK